MWPGEGKTCADSGRGWEVYGGDDDGISMESKVKYWTKSWSRGEQMRAMQTQWRSVQVMGRCEELGGKYITPVIFRY